MFKCKLCAGHGFTWNYTHNLRPFWDAASDHFKIPSIYDWEGREVNDSLVNDLDRMESWLKDKDVSFTSKYEPPNGWGSTKGAVLFLSKLLHSARELKSVLDKNGESVYVVGVSA